MLNNAAMSQRFLEHVAKIASLVLLVVNTSTTAMLSQKNRNFLVGPMTCPYLGSYHNIEYLLMNDCVVHEA